MIFNIEYNIMEEIYKRKYLKYKKKLLALRENLF
jgi:hypothetical protein